MTNRSTIIHNRPSPRAIWHQASRTELAVWAASPIALAAAAIQLLIGG